MLYYFVYGKYVYSILGQQSFYLFKSVVYIADGNINKAGNNISKTFPKFIEGYSQTSQTCPCGHLY
jgi:hypothetical protein